MKLGRGADEQTGQVKDSEDYGNRLANWGQVDGQVRRNIQAEESMSRKLFSSTEHTGSYLSILGFENKGNS